MKIFDQLPTKLPMPDKTRGKLKRELELLPKMSFARGASAEQKAQRMVAVEDLLDADLAARKNKALEIRSSGDESPR